MPSFMLPLSNLSHFYYTKKLANKFGGDSFYQPCAMVFIPHLKDINKSKKKKPLFQNQFEHKLKENPMKSYNHLTLKDVKIIIKLASQSLKNKVFKEQALDPELLKSILFANMSRLLIKEKQIKNVRQLNTASKLMWNLSTSVRRYMEHHYLEEKLKEQLWIILKSLKKLTLV